LKRHKKIVIRLKIREIAESKKINMSKLSRMADVNYNTIRGIWDNPNRDVAVTTLEKIATALRVKVSDLYEILPDEDSEKN
jgi:DNA-binding Xre family transcriptional regulator